MMTVIITESQYSRLTETVVPMVSERIGMIAKFIDSRFMKATSKDGRPAILYIDNFGKPIRESDKKDMFYILQDEFKTIASPEMRDRLIKAAINDWLMNGSIKNGILRNNF